MTDNNSWVIVDEREGVGRVDTWNEYLCIRTSDDPDWVEITICRYEMVGEIPADWFDEEGRPLPEYSDGSDYLVVPDYFDGWAGRAKLTGHDGEYLLGELAVDEAVGWIGKAQWLDRREISKNLESLQWKTSNLDTLVATIATAMAGDA
jgi:hypothetical protein